MYRIVYPYLFLLALGLSLWFVPYARRLAIKLRVIDLPHERKVHEGIRPRLGGLAIYAAFMLALGLQLAGFFLWKNAAWFVERFPVLAAQAEMLVQALPRLGIILLGATIMLVLGFIDDRRGLGFSYKIKFAAQFLAAGVLLLGGISTTFMPVAWMNYLITIFWVVGITNAFNLLDNMDGLAAGVALIASFMFVIITVAQAQFFSAMILCLLAGAVAGFLYHNFYPAKIFMGDTGSHFIGYMLATLSITSSYVVPESVNLLPALMPLLILSLPIFDTLSVIVIRVKEHRPIFQGDRRHFSHRLVDLGMSQRGAVVFIYLVAGCIGLAAALLPYLPLWGQILVLLQTVLIYVMITILMHVARRAHENLQTETSATHARANLRT
ncbi:undecaprenyl/decaprenyl-phosphate alpha-N-acetylglucosaminyl 1-phosphate transferase [candidate division KSB1 bacterium]|nr:undecaprenyl/decaprenyl-phosphate alpha-N-acetylglucosaminyl 1-phosphate transferase [candidate division KSB1 bacterium]